MGITVVREIEEALAERYTDGVRSGSTEVCIGGGQDGGFLRIFVRHQMPLILSLSQADVNVDLR